MTFVEQHPSHNHITHPRYWEYQMKMMGKANIFLNHGNKNNADLRISYFKAYDSHNKNKIEAMRSVMEIITKVSGNDIQKKFEEKKSEEGSSGSDSGDNEKQQTIPTKPSKEQESELTKAMKERMELAIRAIAASILAESGGDNKLAAKFVSDSGKEIIKNLTLGEMNKLVVTLQNGGQEFNKQQEISR